MYHIDSEVFNFLSYNFCRGFVCGMLFTILVLLLVHNFLIGKGML